MKRHESIVALSREHHFGLLFCWKIRQGIKNQVPAERILPYIAYFWKQHLKSHFDEEETLLFAPLKDDLVAQAIGEHRHIRSLVETLSQGNENPTPDSLLSLADAVDNHIRFEERTLFPHIEKALPEDQLAVMGEKIQQLHQVQKKDDYADEFWVKT